MAMYRNQMRYVDFNIKNPKCIHCYISDRAYASIITEVMSNGSNETGGVLLGYIINRAWYIMESVDPGMDTVNQTAFFQWDSSYVNHQASRLSKIYHQPVTVLGFWHRHPGSMDYFSGQDEATIRGNLCELKEGLLSMLVNIDPKLRMTFYYCYGNDIMPIRYDVGNKYFPPQLLKYADADELSRRAALDGNPMEIHYEQVINLEALAAKRKKKRPPVQEEPVQGDACETKKVEMTGEAPTPAPTPAPAAAEKSEEVCEEKPAKTSEMKMMQEQMAVMSGEIHGLMNQMAQMSESIGKLAQAIGKAPVETPIPVQEGISEEAGAEIVRKALQKFLSASGQTPEVAQEPTVQPQAPEAFPSAGCEQTVAEPQAAAAEPQGVQVPEGTAQAGTEETSGIDALRLLEILQASKQQEASETTQRTEAPENSERIIVNEYVTAEVENNDETNQGTSM